MARQDGTTKTFKCSRCRQDMPGHRRASQSGQGSRTCDECVEPANPESGGGIVDRARERREHARGRDYRGGVG